MCLATVYKEPDNTVVCKNVGRIDVDGEYVLITDIMGEETKGSGTDPVGGSGKQYCKASV